MCVQAADLPRWSVAGGWSGMRLQSGPLGLPEVSQMCTLPHLVGCLPQMVGLGGSRAEDVALILPCLRWQLSHGSLRSAGALQERQRNINIGFSPSDATMFCLDCGCIFATLRCLAAASQRLFISAAEKFLIMIWPKSYHGKAVQKKAYCIYWVLNSIGLKV